MARDKDQSLLTAAAEQCRFEEVRSRVQQAGLFAAPANDALAAPNRPLQESSPANAELLANMSHDLRSPLNAVIGFSEILRDQLYGPLNKKQHEFVTSIQASGLILLALIDDLLDLATVETGVLTLELSPFSLLEALDAAVLRHREQAMKSGVTLHLEFAPSADVRILADPGKFKRIMFTLLANAVKFTSAGGTVNVSIMRDNDCIEITVADTGLGIKVAEISQLFQASPRQQQAAETGKDEEISPGLALIRQLVELHGGRIWVKSYFGMGSRFTFTLPLVQTKSGIASAHPAENQRGDGKTILLIEDEQLTLAATEHALHDKGYRVLRAKDGEDGIEMARHDPPDLIVLDLMLPGINGFDVVERMHNERVAENVPILILTSMKILSADRERLAGKVWKIAGKGSLSTHEFINLVENAVG
jgi:signal transduction histidine kinase/CheY-like chemotaxis protein